MNSFKVNFFTMTMVSLLALTGCGDLFKKKVVKKALGSDIGKVSCELTIDNFSSIMEKDIKEDINCLRDNLHLFIRIVETNKPGYLKRQNLKEYLINNRPDIKPDVINALDAVFDLNFLVFGDSREAVSKDQVDKLLDVALVFNTQASTTYKLFKSKVPSTFARHADDKKRVESAAATVAMGLKNIYNPSRNGEIHSLDIIEVFKSFTTDENRNSIEKVKKLLFVKSILVGGEDNILTHVELEKLVLNLNHLFPIVFDVVRYKHIILKQDSILQLLNSDIDWLGKMIFQDSMPNRDNTVFFTIEQAIEAFKVLTEDSEDPFDIEKYRNLLKEAKMMAMGGDDVKVTGRDFRTLLIRGNEVLKKGTIFHRIYEYFRPQLENTDPVSIDFTRYRHQYPEHDKELTEFIRIVTKYRFFRGEFLSPYFSYQYRRNADGVFEVAMFEYIIDLAFKNSSIKRDANGQIVYDTSGNPVKVPWGTPSNGLGGYSMTSDNVLDLLKRFEKELAELDIILPGRVASTANNVALLGTLFQYQSDNNKVLDVNEMTEFAGTLLTSFDVAKDVFSFMKLEDRDGNQIGDNGRAACPTDEFGRVDPACFRTHFFRGVCKYYRSYYPKMFEYMGLQDDRCENFNSETEVARAFLDTTIAAARTCNFYPDGAKEEIPYTEGDASTIFIALMHIEATILRWDVNKNNIMDASEVDSAYAIYESALDGFVDGVIKKVKKQIYQYLVKYETVPDQKQFGSIWKFVKFLVSFNKKAPASRKTIAAILKAVGEQSTKQSIERGEPQFDCKKLRNPDILMEGYKNLDFSSVKSGYTRLSLEDVMLKSEIEKQSDAEIQAELRVTNPELFR